MTLGPVTGNRYAGANKAQPKANLQERLNEQAQRKTSEGTFKTGADGRTTFVPKLTNQQVLGQMRAMELKQLLAKPTPGMLAKRAAEEARSTPAEGDDEREAMGLAAAEAGVLTPSEAAQQFAPVVKGDKVQTITGLVGVVVDVTGEWVRIHHASWKWPATVHRDYLKLVQKAGD